jgi:hypothetical protein
MSAAAAISLAIFSTGRPETQRKHQFSASLARLNFVEGLHNIGPGALPLSRCSLNCRRKRNETADSLDLARQEVPADAPIGRGARSGNSRSIGLSNQPQADRLGARRLGSARPRLPR